MPTYPSPSIINSRKKKLAGKRIITSLTDNRTAALWKSFMPVRHQLNAVGTNLFSVQVYPHGYYDNFDPSVEFEKWAAIEIADINGLPDGFEAITLPAGLYAVFHYKGSGMDTAIFRYIFTEWLPGSGYQLDHRPHFEILGEKYRNADPSSEEEICIPVKPL